ncbi:MAG: hypothetical protein J5824_04540 [Lachnospiraceae bacterium]|nr:hypothetical protein [Lachnospiraceae bacterium]
MIGNMRKYLALILVFVMVFTSGCTKNDITAETPETAKTEGTSSTGSSAQGTAAAQNGSDKNGEAGPSENAGTDNTSGDPHTEGNSGSDGTSDPAGNAGTNEAAGTSDQAGNNGTNGTSDPAGNDGTDSTSDPVGNDGTNGTSDSTGNGGANENAGTDETAGSGTDGTSDGQGTPGYEYDYELKEEQILERFLGTWYLDRGEIEGYDWTAEDEENICWITFAEDFTAKRVHEYLEDDPLIEEGSCKCGYDEDLEDFYVDVDFGREDASFSYSINGNGELEQYGYLTYDGDYPVLSYAVYTREPFWGEGNYFDRYAKTVPERIQELIDNAPENAGLVAITDPDAELSQACTDGKWELIDESDNKWVNCPWNNPKEMIIANCSDRRVSLEVHEPNSEYDPKSSEDGWEAGPFMYFADLKPGELCRFIVDLPENKIDATMCLYIEFEGVESKYYLRIFRYDDEDPYIIFPGF